MFILTLQSISTLVVSLGLKTGPAGRGQGQGGGLKDRTTEPALPLSSTRSPGCPETLAHTASRGNVPRPPASGHFLKLVILR